MNKFFSLKIQLIFIVLMLMSCVKENEKLCLVENHSLNEISPYYDGQWQGITVASDGACYFGSSSHNLIHGGGFFKFDPQTNSLDVLAEDLTDLVGDDMSKHTPQGKIHSPIIEHDGVLYMATHLAAYWKETLDKYAGSYFLGYDMKAKDWINYGIVKEGFSTYSAIEVNNKTGKGYAMTVPFAPKDTIMGNRLMEIDLKTKEKRDLGRFGEGRACFNFFMDDLGRIWASHFYGNGSLYCYDPQNDTIKDYEDAFPEAKYLNGENLANHTPSYSKNAWTWLEPIDGASKCLFVMGDKAGGDERLWMFDPHQDIASKKAFTPICYIGTTFLSVAKGGDRVYFTQRGSNEDSRNYGTEGMRDEPIGENGYHVNNIHLKSVSLDPNAGYKIIDHGKLIDKQGRTAAYIGAIAADDKGNVYMSGSWLIKEGDQPTLQYMYKSSDGKVQGALTGPDEVTTEDNNSLITSDQDFKEMKRGEFFSVMNVSGDF